MKTPQITPKLEADAHEIRWICTTGCPKKLVHGNFVSKQKKFRTLKDQLQKNLNVKY